MRRAVPIIVVAASSLVGCSHQPLGRNPVFAAATAPGPSVMVAPIDCSQRLHPNIVDLDADARGVVQERFGASGVEVSLEQRAALCAIVVSEDNARRMHADDGILGEHGDWDEGAAVSKAVHDVAELHSAKSLLVTLALAVPTCNDFELANQDARCGLEFGFMVRTFLFSQDGTVLWRSKADRRAHNDHDLEIAFGRALDEAPVAIVRTEDDSDSGKFDVEALITRELGPAPDECKEIARRFCAKTATMMGDSEAGESTCKTFVDSQRTNYRASSAKEMCAASLR